MRRATYKMADTLSSIWKHVANDTTISRLYSLYTAIRKLVYFNTDNVDWLLSLSQLNDVPGGGGSRNKQCLNTTRNCLLLTWRPRFNCISVGPHTRHIPVCLYRKQKKSLLAIAPPLPFAPLPAIGLRSRWWKVRTRAKPSLDWDPGIATFDRWMRLPGN